jgi:CHAT domain-containing protein
MPPPSSVTTWLQRLRAGDTASAQVLWERYYADLVRLAHAHLAARLRRTVDAEDIALSAFASFCRVERGKGRPALPQTPVVPESDKDEPPYAHPFYWAAFVLVGDKD